jgi:hypothetical protein
MEIGGIRQLFADPISRRNSFHVANLLLPHMALIFCLGYFEFSVVKKL